MSHVASSIQVLRPAINERLAGVGDDAPEMCDRKLPALSGAMARARLPWAQGGRGHFHEPWALAVNHEMGALPKKDKLERQRKIGNSTAP